MRREWSVIAALALTPNSVSATECLDYGSFVRWVAHDARYGQHEASEQWQGFLWTGGWYAELRGWPLGDSSLLA